jgi:hypothetical protein
MPSKASRVTSLIVSVGREAAEGAPSARGPPRCVLPTVPILGFARRARRPPPARSGKTFCATAIRMSAGSPASSISLDRRSFGDAVEHPSSTAMIRSAKIVVRLGVARVRPPRRSPGFEPLGMTSSLCFGGPAARSAFRPIGYHQLTMVSLGLSAEPLLLGLDLCPADPCATAP